MKKVQRGIGKESELEKSSGDQNQSYSGPKRESAKTVEKYIVFLEDQVQEKDDQIENLQARLEKSMKITERRIEGETQTARWWRFRGKLWANKWNRFTE